jgi:hypothetical protein
MKLLERELSPDDVTFPRHFDDVKYYVIWELARPNILYTSFLKIVLYKFATLRTIFVLFCTMRTFYYRHRSTTWLVIFFVALLIILTSIRRKRSLRKSWSNDERGLFRFDHHTREIQVRNLKGEVILEGNLGMNIGSSYSNPEESTKDGLHYTWGGHILQSIMKGDKNCITIDWDSISDEPFTPMDCFNLGRFYWYGGGQLNVPSWPLNKADLQMSPFYAKVYKDIDNQHFTSVIEPYWLSSSGVAIYVDEIVPLHVSINEKGNGKLCLKADTEGYPGHPKPVHLKYRMCFGNNMKSTHQFVASKYFDKPSESLSSSMIRYPICGLKSPNQVKMTRFFRSIVIRQFSCGHIDLGLQRGLEFNKQDFPNPKVLVKEIQARKLKVTAMVDSVFDTKQNVPKEFLMKSNWQTNSLDLSNLKARNWFTEKLTNFQKKFGINMIRLCCGELEYPITEYNLGGRNPGVFVQNYAKVAASISKSTDIAVGYKTQSLPLVIKIADRYPNWGKDDGLRSIIPTVLSVGLIGYPFVTIGPIGGNAEETTTVDKELYIRWMQLSVFFPVMEFVTYPWEYDDSDTVQASADILDIRYMLWDNILAIGKESVDTGAPIVRPMWWLAPNDHVTHNLSAQFMLGDIYLVAPVMWSQVKKHEVYLPKGVWREMFGKGIKHELEVGQWITFKVDMKTVVYFECLICKS